MSDNMRHYFTLLTIIFPFFFFISDRTGLCNDIEFHQILKTMKHNFENTESYQCIYESYTQKGKRSRLMSFNYYFKQPNMIRMEVIEGKYPGTILIYNPSIAPDKVRVIPSSSMMAFFQKLIYGEYFDLKNKWVVDLRNHSVNESHWGWFIDEHIRIAESAESNYTIHREGETTINGFKTLVFTLISDSPDKALDVKKEKLWIDKSTYFPVKHIQYDSSGRIMQSSSFTSIKFNRTIEDELFIDIKKE